MIWVGMKYFNRSFLLKKTATLFSKIKSGQDFMRYMISVIANQKILKKESRVNPAIATFIRKILMAWVWVDKSLKYTDLPAQRPR